ncbi:period circadian protein homolog 3 isoform X2 [Strigops habroptila]|uniref:period circadian protein homolog 3 isoform X2 n=1 Tax=Strigops habroptila TaxID=2489341 RepID=UPI0011D01E64|nr:period circadian protein homolog 3 isoform X2 [Strigops habroptila]
MDVGKLRGGGSERGASWSAAAAGAREEAFGPAARPRGEAGSGCAVCPGTGSGGRGFDAPDAGEADFCGREANGCSAGSFGRHGKVNSEQLNWSQSHKDMVMMIQEMKRCLPEDKRSSSKPSTISALNYALRCVQQVQANNDFFQALSDRRVFQTDVVTYSVEELVAVASEHTPKNTDTFVAVFSLLSGRMVHISEQAASILNCKKKLLDSSRFVELLVPQDVSVFYTHTDQSHLPLWNMESQTASLYEYAQVKSFFCRIRSGKDEETRYYPFRITPYLVHVCTSVHVDTESCCLALAEKIHSGYEAPRIPMDKRIFTTTHTPGCVFLDIDDRAVPLLGYLPQDLIGTSILMYLHPEDRPLMVAIHRKILKFAGQPPFEHLPIRFCTQNGDYVILDTSWSSFVNPWSRKVVFIIGRHKVRTSPLNEDVFAARSKETSRVEKEIRELQGQIYKLLLQPVHSNVSSGYGSRGSNGSYEHYMSIASSSDSNGNCAEDIQEPMTLQQVCADVNRIKNLGQQLYIASRSKPQNGNEQAVSSEILGGKRHTASCSLQTLRSDSTEEPGNAFYDGSKKTPSVPSYQQINCVDSIIRYLESCSIPALKRKCKSSANTSSSSSEDDKQVQQSHQEAEALEDTAILSAVNSQTPVSADQEETLKDKTAAGMVGAPLADLTLSNKAPSVVSVTSQCSYSSTIVHVPHPESVTTMEDTTAGSEQIELPPVNAQNLTVVPEDLKPVGLTKETLSVHTQKEEQNYVDKFRQRILLSPFRTYLQQGSRNNKGHSRGQGDSTSKQMSPSSCKKGKHGKSKRQKPQRKLSDNHSTSKNRNSLPCVKRTIQKQSFSPSEVSCLSSSNTNVLPPVGFPVCLDPLSSFPASSVGEELAIHSLKPEPMSSSQLRCGAQSCPAFYPPNIGTFMAVFFQSFPMYAQMPQYVFLPSPQYVYLPSSYPCTVLPPAPPPPAPSPVAPHAADQPFPVSFATSMEDQQEGQCAQALLLSSSRSSSPLQLNLLQEELPKPMELFTSTDVKAHAEAKCDNDPEDSVNSANCCASSEFTDHLLYEGSLSGAGSAASGSGSALSVSSGSSSNETSGSGTGSGKSTKYFPSNDSSEASKEKNQEAEEKGTAHKSSHESAWMMMDHTPEQVLMTYQMPNRITEEVLKEDLEKLAVMRKQQPWFSDGQKEELAEVHTWIRTQTVPLEISTQGCVTCDIRDASCEAAMAADNMENKGKLPPHLQH